MIKAILGGFVAVLVLMVILFRSVSLGVLSMMPLTFAITLSYGLAGFVGKEYDMPIAVVSSLALGLSEDDRWIFIPAIKLVRRIAADDKRSSFIGSDFTYEDISGRAADDEIHTLLRTEQVFGRAAYVIESKPKTRTNYIRRLSWIDQQHGLPLKEEYFDARDEKVRVFTADQIEQIDGHWTVTSRTMKNLQTGHRTQVRFTAVKYDVGLKENLFSERYLRTPPRKWIR